MVHMDFPAAILRSSACDFGCLSNMEMDDSSRLRTVRTTTTMTTTLTTPTTMTTMTATMTTTTMMMMMQHQMTATAIATTRTTTTMSVSVVVTPVKTEPMVLPSMTTTRRRTQAAMAFPLRLLFLRCFCLRFPPPNQSL
jgi:hypothetical protein